MGEGSKRHGVYSVCVLGMCQCVKRENLLLFFQLVGVPTLFAGLLCFGGVWVEVDH